MEGAKEIYQIFDELYLLKHNPYIRREDSSFTVEYRLKRPDGSEITFAFSSGINREADHYIVSDNRGRSIIIRADNGHWANIVEGEDRPNILVENCVSFLKEIKSLLTQADNRACKVIVPLRDELEKYALSRQFAPPRETLSLEEIEGLTLRDYRIVRNIAQGIPLTETERQRLLSLAKFILSTRSALFAFQEVRERYGFSETPLPDRLMKAAMGREVKLTEDGCIHLLQAPFAQLVEIYLHRQAFASTVDEGREMDAWLRENLPDLRKLED